MHGQKEEVLIKSFVTDLFNSNISEEDIVKKYLVDLKYEKKYSISLHERKGNQLKHIKGIRENMLKNNIESGWLIPDKANGSLDNVVANYMDYKHLDKYGWSHKQKKRITRNMYVLLDSKKETILEYFLLKKGKIKSYTILIKSGDASFFVY